MARRRDRVPLQRTLVEAHRVLPPARGPRASRRTQAWSSGWALSPIPGRAGARARGLAQLRTADGPL
eukprot:820354-Alexandrium_andersonii.AAC.1